MEDGSPQSNLCALASHVQADHATESPYRLKIIFFKYVLFSNKYGQRSIEVMLIKNALSSTDEDNLAYIHGLASHAPFSFLCLNYYWDII